MQRVSKRLNVAPMTLYGYFPSRNALLQAVAAEVFSRLDTQAVDNAATWQDKIRLWCLIVRNHMRSLPQMLRLVTNPAQVTAAWLEASEPLLRTLEEAGLDRAGVAYFGRWIGRGLIGIIVVETAFDDAIFTSIVSNAEEVMANLTPQSTARLESLLGEVIQQDEDQMFARTVDTFVMEVERFLDEQRRSTPAEATAALLNGRTVRTPLTGPAL